MLEEIDEHTFVRFSQYAYTGDYTTADPEILLDTSTIAITHSTPNKTLPDPVKVDIEEVSAPATSVDDGLGTFSISKKAKKKEKKRVLLKCTDEEVRDYDYELLEAAGPVAITVRSKKWTLWDSFKSNTYAISTPAFQARRNHDPCENYIEVFLCHVRLYVFGDKYDIGSLKRLSLHKLHQTLVGFTLYDERVENIVDLIRYSYSNTADLLGSIDDMRLLIIHYAACVVEDLIRNTKFRTLLEESSD